MCDKNVKKWEREVEGILGERERIFKEKKKKKHIHVCGDILKGRSLFDFEERDFV